MAKTKMRTVDMSIDPDQLDEMAAVKTTDDTTEEAETPEEGKKKAVKVSHERSDKYKAARRNVDRTKTYDLNRAVDLVKSTSYTNFTGTITADIVVKDEKLSTEITFPHQTGRSVTVVIADDKVLEQIEKGDINFDILVATPQMMPKLAKHARVLGPKGLMPNPKNGTVTPDPEKRKKELEAGKTTIKTEKKAPLIHVVLGKTDMETKALVENTEALIKAVGPRKMVKLTLAATMSPGIKVDLTSYQTA